MNKNISISANEKKYGLRYLQRKIEKCQKQLKEYEGKDLSSYGYIQLGRLQEAIYIYEDMLDYWQEKGRDFSSQK